MMLSYLSKNLLEKKIEDYESGEEAFLRYQRLNDYKRMMKAALEIERQSEKIY